jgi:hypothetical protein
MPETNIGVHAAHPRRRAGRAHHLGHPETHAERLPIDPRAPPTAGRREEGRKARDGVSDTPIRGHLTLIDDNKTSPPFSSLRTEAPSSLAISSCSAVLMECRWK